MSTSERLERSRWLRREQSSSWVVDSPLRIAGRRVTWSSSTNPAASVASRLKVWTAREPAPLELLEGAMRWAQLAVQARMSEAEVAVPLEDLCLVAVDIIEHPRATAALKSLANALWIAADDLAESKHDALEPLQAIRDVLEAATAREQSGVPLSLSTVAELNRRLTREGLLTHDEALGAALAERASSATR